MFIKISEQPSLYNDLEKKSIREILEDINAEDQKVALATQKAIPQIEKLVSQIVPRMKQGGRIFYMGAGTSGRLGVLDASEIPPTFGMPPTWIIGLIAGFASGYVGVGGGFIMVPLMTAWLGIPMKRTSGTSLIAIIILAIPGVIQQAFLGHIDYLAGIMLCVGAIPGAVLGARLVSRVPERTLRFIFSGLLAVAAVVLVVNEFGLL